MESSTSVLIVGDDAVLIRPDGFIAWRHATSANGATALENALERLRIRTGVKTGGHVK